MKIIPRIQIDTERWDALVASDTDSDIFSLSRYLDATAENWCVLVNDNYTGGMALPFTIRLGIKTCYTPIFVRSVRWMGEKAKDRSEILQLLNREFPKGQLAIEGFSSQISDKNFVFQNIDIQINRKISERGKRMLKKFDAAKFTIQVVAGSDDILNHISLELPKRIKEINKGSVGVLRELTRSFAATNDFIGMQVYDQESKSVGGILLLRNKKKLLYLKGAFEAQAKKNGAMYGVMNQAIEMAHSMNLNFDFGGSKVQGVRDFNLTLGGEDKFYEVLTWDFSPWWFKLVKRAKDLWKRK